MDSIQVCLYENKNLVINQEFLLSSPPTLHVDVVRGLWSPPIRSPQSAAEFTMAEFKQGARTPVLLRKLHCCRFGCFQNNVLFDGHQRKIKLQHPSVDFRCHQSGIP